MQCNCLKEVDERLKEHNCKLPVSLILSGPNAGKCMLNIQTVVIEKKRGFKPPSMGVEFCPFCGKSVKAEEVNDAM